MGKKKQKIQIGSRVKISAAGVVNVIHSCRNTNGFYGAAGIKIPDKVFEGLMTSTGSICTIGRDKLKALVTWDSWTIGIWIEVKNLEIAE